MGTPSGSWRKLRRTAKGMLAARTPQALSLSQLGGFYGTDKVDLDHTFLGRTNCDVYDKYLAGWRRRRFAVLEIGVLGGASLRMWRSYFPRARVIGLDIDPEAARLASEGFALIVGSQADPAVLDRALELASSELRLVVDDGSHVNELTAASMDYLFPKLPSGAIYVIEDTLCTYQPALRTWPGMEYNPEQLDLNNDRATIDGLLASLMRDCDLGIPAFSTASSRTVAFVHAWPGLIIVGRA